MTYDRFPRLCLSSYMSIYKENWDRCRTNWKKGMSGYCCYDRYLWYTAEPVITSHTTRELSWFILWYFKSTDETQSSKQIKSTIWLSQEPVFWWAGDMFHVIPTCFGRANFFARLCLCAWPSDGWLTVAFACMQQQCQRLSNPLQLDAWAWDLAIIQWRSDVFGRMIPVTNRTVLEAGSAVAHGHATAKALAPNLTRFKKKSDSSFTYNFASP